MPLREFSPSLLINQHWEGETNPPTYIKQQKNNQPIKKQQQWKWQNTSCKFSERNQ